MESLIYYPTFEPPTQNWLKFALLYFENFRPIVPYNLEHLLSDDFRRITNETDLVTLYSPDHLIGERASLSAIEDVEKILQQPKSRSRLFGQENIIRRWNNRSNRTFKVYQEKFSDDWVLFCEKHNIGTRVEGGIILPEELAFLFMTHLAKEIAFIESTAIITDNNRFDNYTNYDRATTPYIDRRTKFAKGIINLLVPSDLIDIPIEKLIKFRNQKRKLITAFNQELDTVQQKISGGFSEKDFINSYNHIYSEFSREVLLQGIGLAAIPLAAYILLQNPNATTPEYVKEILGAVGMVLGGGYALNKGLRDIKTKRYCKKYLINLERIR